VSHPARDYVVYACGLCGKRIFTERAHVGARGACPCCGGRHTVGGDPVVSAEEGVERRRAPRHRYERRVEALCWRGGDGPRVALGRDLSVSGMRLVTSPPPPVGAEVALALYGGAREEPVVVRGRVVRSEEIEAALRFEGLAPGERRGLERLLGAAPHLEDLRGQGEPVLVAELL